MVQLEVVTSRRLPSDDLRSRLLGLQRQAEQFAPQDLHGGSEAGHGRPDALTERVAHRAQGCLVGEVGEFHAHPGLARQRSGIGWHLDDQCVPGGEDLHRPFSAGRSEGGQVHVERATMVPVVEDTLEPVGRRSRRKVGPLEGHEQA